MTDTAGVIFDLDGTLIDSIGAFIQAFNQTIEPLGLQKLPKEDVSSIMNGSRHIREVFYELSPALFSQEDVMRKSMETMRDIYFQLQKKEVTLMPGAMEVLTQLKEKGMKLGIVTARTTHGDIKWLEIRRLGIDHFIDAIVTGADAARKPAPDGILHCLDQLGVAAKDTCFVGDTDVDIIAGKRANVKVIALSTEFFDRTRLAAQEPAAIIDNLGQLIQTIEQLSGTRNR